MWEFNEITDAQYRDGYVFEITFDDGACANVDFSRYLGLGPIFEPLRDLEFFRRARIEDGTLAWPNGADIAPETLYEEVSRARTMKPTTP